MMRLRVIGVKVMLIYQIPPAGSGILVEDGLEANYTYSFHDS